MSIETKAVCKTRKLSDNTRQYYVTIKGMEFCTSNIIKRSDRVGNYYQNDSYSGHWKKVSDMKIFLIEKAIKEYLETKQIYLNNGIF